MNTEELSALVVDTAFHLHKDLGPGLLESAYESVLARVLEERGLSVERQKTLAFYFHGMHFNKGLRIDLLVNETLAVELRSVETLAPVHAKQLLTYLRLLGLLINFGAATFKDGCKRIVNQHSVFASSHEPVDVRSPCLNDPLSERYTQNRVAALFTDPACADRPSCYG